MRCFQVGGIRRAGFTIIELAISVSVLVMLLGVVTMFESRGHSAARSIQTLSNLELRTDRALNQLTSELSTIGVHTLAPDPVTNLGAETITFQTPLSVSAAGVVTWNAPTRIALLMDKDEVDNGLDDDNDGLVDERQIVLTREVGGAAERSTVVCHGVAAWLEDESGNGLDDNGNGLVDERGFSLHRIGDLLELRLTLQAVGEKQNVIFRTSNTAIVIHN